LVPIYHAFHNIFSKLVLIDQAVCHTSLSLSLSLSLSGDSPQPDSLEVRCLEDMMSHCWHHLASATWKWQLFMVKNRKSAWKVSVVFLCSKVLFMSPNLQFPSREDTVVAS